MSEVLERGTAEQIEKVFEEAESSFGEAESSFLFWTDMDDRSALRVGSEAGNVECWKFFANHLRSMQDVTAGATCKFIVKLFREGILTLDNHGGAVMVSAINRAKQQGIVEFLHRRGVGIPWTQIETVEGLRTGLMLDEPRARVFVTRTGYDLISYCALSLTTPARMKMLQVLLDHGFRFGRDVLRFVVQPQRREGRNRRLDLARMLLPENYDGDLCRDVTAETPRLAFAPSILPVLGRWIDMPALPTPSARMLAEGLDNARLDADLAKLFRERGGGLWADLDPRIAHAIAFRCALSESWPVIDTIPIATAPFHVIAALFQGGAPVRGVARRIRDGDRSLLPPCIRYPRRTVEGVGACLAAGYSPKFILSVCHKWRSPPSPRVDEGVAALVALFPLPPSLTPEEQEKRIRKMLGGRGGLKRAVGIGLQVRGPPKESYIPAYVWTSTILPFLFRIEAPGAGWRVRHRAKPRLGSG